MKAHYNCVDNTSRFQKGCTASLSQRKATQSAANLERLLQGNHLDQCCSVLCPASLQGEDDGGIPGQTGSYLGATLFELLHFSQPYEPLLDWELVRYFQNDFAFIKVLWSSESKHDELHNCQLVRMKNMVMGLVRPVEFEHERPYIEKQTWTSVYSSETRS
jgi:hypothetical protein